MFEFLFMRDIASKARKTESDFRFEILGNLRDSGRNIGLLYLKSKDKKKRKLGAELLIQAERCDQAQSEMCRW